MPIDYKKYPPNWKTEIVPRILSRAKNKCEHCFLENRSIVYSVRLKVQDDDGRYKLKAFWFVHKYDAIRAAKFGRDPEKVKVVLTIAHMDHDEFNHEVKDDRLKALCQHCHLNYDAKEKYRRSLLKTTDTQHPKN